LATGGANTTVVGFAADALVVGAELTKCAVTVCYTDRARVVTQVADAPVIVARTISVVRAFDAGLAAACVACRGRRCAGGIVATTACLRIGPTGGPAGVSVTVRIVRTLYTLAGGRIAHLTVIAVAVDIAGDAALEVSVTDRAVGAVTVCGAFHADAAGCVAGGGRCCALVVIEARHTAVRGGVADLVVAAVVVNRTFDADRPVQTGRCVTGTAQVQVVAGVGNTGDTCPASAINSANFRPGTARGRAVQVQIACGADINAVNVCACIPVSIVVEGGRACVGGVDRAADTRRSVASWIVADVSIRVPDTVGVCSALDALTGDTQVAVGEPAAFGAIETGAACVVLADIPRGVTDACIIIGALGTDVGVCRRIAVIAVLVVQADIVALTGAAHTIGAHVPQMMVGAVGVIPTDHA